MILYDENNRKVKFNTTNKVGDKVYGNVYKISDSECIKVYKDIKSVDKEILAYIRDLHLKNFYDIHNFYYTWFGHFKAHTMKYYQKENIDILKVPTSYTLDNLSQILESVSILTENNIQIEDSHTDNIIMNRDNITIIDVDLYVFNRFYTDKELSLRNIKKIGYLFKKIYTLALKEYHRGYITDDTIKLINTMFDISTINDFDKVKKELSKYTYPIDYIEDKTRVRKRVY